jgi:hypothetical protein
MTEDDWAHAKADKTASPLKSISFSNFLPTANGQAPPGPVGNTTARSGVGLPSKILPNASSALKLHPQHFLPTGHN